MLGEKMKILLVDDDENHIELISCALKDASREIELSVASSLDEARHFLAEKRPDIMIADYRLPDGEGVELLPGSVERRSMPIIILTGHGDEKIAAAALKAGAMDYIVKSDENFVGIPHLIERTLLEWEYIIEQRRIEKALKVSEERYKGILDSNRVIAWEFNRKEDCFTFVSGHVEEITGYTLDQWYEKDFWGRHLHPDDREQAIAFCQGSDKAVRGREFEHRFIKADGGEIWLRDIVSVVIDSKTASSLKGLFVDISELKQTELELERSRSLLDAIVENIPAMIFLKCASNLEYELFNRAGEKLLGYDRNDLIGKSDYDLFDKEQADFFTAKDKEVLDSHESMEIPEESITIHDGSKRMLHTFKTGLYDSHDNPTHLLGISTDITERKQAEEALVESEHYLELAQGIAHLGHWKLDPRTNEIFGSSELFRIFGLKPNENRLDAFASVVHPEDREYDLKHIQGGIEQGKDWDIEHRLLLEDGTIKYVHAIGHALKKKSGKVEMLVGTVQDITERKQVEQNLFDSESRLRESILNSPNPIMMHAEDGEVLMLSRMWTAITGYELKEIPTIEIWVDKAFGVQAEAVMAYIRTLYALKEVRQEGVYEVITASGEVRQWDFQSQPLQKLPDGRRVALTLATDITTRQQAEAELRQSESNLREAHQIAQMGRWELDLISNTLLWSDTIYEIFGIDREQFIASYEAFLDVIHPDDRDAVNQAYTNSLTDKKPYDIEHRLLMKDGSIKWVHEYCRTDYDAEGKALRSVGIVQDITERKQSENIVQASLNLSEFALTHSLDELLTRTLDEAEVLTGSQISFFHFVDADQKMLLLQAWSTNTLQNMCSAEGLERHYPVDQAGVWVDCLHQKRPLIHNDYESLPHKKGLPEGHAPIIRELVVPVIRGGKIMAIIGVGNKNIDYTEKDIEAVSRLFNLSWDIIEVKQADHLIKSSHAAMHAMINNLPFLAWLKDSESRFLLVNDRFAKACGSPDMNWLVGKTDLDIWPKELAEAYLADDRKVMESRSSKVVEEQVAEIDGIKWFETYKSVVLDADGQMAGTVGIARDITQRQLGEEERRKIQTLVNQASDIVFLCDDNSTVVYVNHAIEHIAGAKPEEIIGKPFGPLFEAQCQAIAMDNYLAALKGENRAFELAFKNTGILCEYKIQPYRDITGDIIGVLGSARDISERIQSEVAFQAIIKGTVGVTGQEFFEKVVSSLCEWLGVECAIVSETVSEAHVRALAMQVDGNLIKHYEYDLAGTPCGNANTQGYCAHQEHVCDLFPDDKDLVEMKAQGYYGVALRDKSGKTVGILCVISRHKLSLQARTREVFDIIAGRTTAEIERSRAEDKLRDKFDEIERMNRLMVGRELKMEELRQEIHRLKEKGNEG